MPDNLTVIVKAANQSVADQHIECDSTWTVSNLKQHLANVHPAKPRVDEQRLIYCGQLLGDNLVLQSALRHPTENNAYTIHLVCSAPRHTPSSPQKQPSPQPSTSQTPSTSPSPSPSASPSSPASTSSAEMAAAAVQEPVLPTQSDTPVNSEATDGVRRRNVSPTTTMTTEGIDGTSTHHMNIHASHGPMQQMAAMQQMYANYMAYVQYMQMGGALTGLAWPQHMMNLPTSTHTAGPTATTTTTPDVVEPPQPQLDQMQPPENQPQQQPPQIRMNAQGVEVDEDDEDEGMGRDWLDWIYVLSRMLVLLSVVYFYSTLSRFMVVVFIAVLLYLYQAGWFRPARRIDQPAQQNQPNQQQQQQQQPDDQNNNNNNEPDQPEPPQPQNNDTDGNGPTDGEDERTEVVEGAVVRPSLLALSWTFLTTFFTSLIPDQPQVI